MVLNRSFRFSEKNLTCVPAEPRCRSGARTVGRVVVGTGCQADARHLFQWVAGRWPLRCQGASVPHNRRSEDTETGARAGASQAPPAHGLTLLVVRRRWASGNRGRWLGRNCSEEELKGGVGHRSRSAEDSLGSWGRR